MRTLRPLRLEEERKEMSRVEKEQNETVQLRVSQGVRRLLVIATVALVVTAMSTAATAAYVLYPFLIGGAAGD
jgi:hypothetical protein